jgi:allophanate hydrolase
VPSRLDDAAAGARWPGPSASLDAGGPIRLLPGPHADRFSSPVLDALVTSAWSVSVASDRMGLRLDGEAPVSGAGGSSGGIVSIPVIWGAIQVPADGRPIVLLADHQTVGGYPVVGCVISADLPRLGQLAATDEVRFTWTTVDDARDAYRGQRADLAEGARSLRRGDPWDRLSEGAEG